MFTTTTTTTPTTAIRANHQIFSGNGLSIEGDYNSVTGSNCIIKGNYNTLEGMSGTIVGDYNTLNSMNGNIRGNHNTLTGMNLTVVGDYNTLIDSMNGTANGNFNILEGMNTEAFGSYNTVEGMNSRQVTTLISSSRPYQRATTGLHLTPRLPTQHNVVNGPSVADLSHDYQPNDHASPSCIICLENAPICIASPCYHLSYCVRCARCLCYGQQGTDRKERGQLKCACCNCAVDEIKRVYQH